MKQMKDLYALSIEQDRYYQKTLTKRFKSE